MTRLMMGVCQGQEARICNTAGTEVGCIALYKGVGIMDWRAYIHSDPQILVGKSVVKARGCL